MLRLKADFSVIDDLVSESSKGLLRSHGKIDINQSGRIGPLIELMMASAHWPEQFDNISSEIPYLALLRSALANRTAFGSGYSDTAGAFPCGVENPQISDGHEWDLWTKHAENMASRQGLNRNLIDGLLGAFGELLDNIYEHSERPETGIAAYAVTADSFEFVVADAGIGVLQSLLNNPLYTEIQDAGTALELAITDGVSRFPAETNRGRGFGQLFRSLVGNNAELRFRSDDHALVLSPGVGFAEGTRMLSQKSRMPGLLISVYCDCRALIK